MALGPRLEVRQRLSQKMTPQLQQAIQLLQMNSIQISDFVKAEVEKNPLLEMASPETEVYSAIPAGASGASPEGNPFQNITSQITLHDYLRFQIREMRLTPDQLELGLTVADEIDLDGYLREPVSELSERYHIPAKDILSGLKLVQRCEPTGVGARNLRECLALQLIELDRFDPAMRRLLENLELAVEGNASRLTGICGVDRNDIRDMLAEIRALDPKPGSKFGLDPVLTTAPDVIVHSDATGHLRVEINTMNLPRVLMNNAYAAEIAGSDADARAFVSECRTKANWLIRALEQRARTILKVSTEIAVFQRKFFVEGVSGLRPLTRKTIAAKIEMHESTVSRVTSGKYLACGKGNFELGFFFSSSIPSVAGGTAYSAPFVQNRIRKLTEGEPPNNVLSDDKIVTLLRDEGIDIARRTVAKYREIMGVPGSADRRRQKAGTGRV